MEITKYVLHACVVLLVFNMSKKSLFQFVQVILHIKLIEF